MQTILSMLTTLMALANALLAANSYPDPIFMFNAFAALFCGASALVIATA